ncbi:LacI family DNA-binding transcriptional regulator [Wocania ichthyoenteri]|uniref:LacI family DNA-binding transcriptional regulator n=1 Tax=Wocania ichthyoenteri TaxID=1230531 RepID=UPI00053E337A|nr:LacI family DNA-binding transcriptional regulator [Wocania ichthyoenteri]
MKKLYLKDIAQNLGLSKTTVSFVLNGKGDENKININTQNKVLEYANKHNYKPNQLARGLSRGKTETIGLIIPNISDTFYAKIAGSIEKRAKEFGYTVVFSSSNENAADEEKLIQSMLNRQVDGLIIASTQQNQKDIELLIKMNFPFILIDRHYPEIETNYVLVDNFGSVKKATEHLLNLGRRKIGFISLKSDLEALKQRLLGYQEALVENNIKTSYIKELGTDTYKEEMKKAVSELIKFPNTVDAIVFSTHYLTALGVRELKNNNIKIPSEVAIVSFDELSAFDLVDPPITSLIQPVNKIGDAAVEILLKDIENKKCSVDKKVILETGFMIRKSCGTV